MISKPRRNRLLFEPEIHETVSLCDLELRGPTLPAEVRADLGKILRNCLNDPRSYRHGMTRFGYHQMNWLIRVLVVKLIRCNLALSHLGSMARSNCVFVLRNPHATVRSQARVSFGHLPQLAKLMENPGVKDFVQEHGYWDRPLTFAESLALRWVIENVYAIRSVKPSANHLLVEYERLRDQPALWAELLETLGVPLRSSDLERGRTRPSATSFPDRAAYQLTRADEAAVDVVFETFRVEEFQSEFRRRAVDFGS